MKRKEVIFWIIVLIIFGTLVFATPAMESETSGTVWTFFIFAMIAIGLLKAALSVVNARKRGETPDISNQSIIVKILFVLFIATAIYDIIHYNSIGSLSSVIILILIMVKFLEWLLKKEE